MPGSQTEFIDMNHIIPQLLVGGRFDVSYVVSNYRRQCLTLTFQNRGHRLTLSGSGNQPIPKFYMAA